MGFDRRFTLVLAAWVAGLVVASCAFAASWSVGGLGATRLILTVWAAAMLAGLVRHVERTNVMLARFTEALRHGDLAARFNTRGGSGFARLGEALNAVMLDLHTARTRDREELRYWEALVDDLPVALLTVDALHGVQPVNKAARRLFDAHDGSDANAFSVYGENLPRRLALDGPLGQEVLSLRVSGGAQRAIVRTAALARLGTPVRIVTVEPVQTTLDAVEMSTQTDLVRVLTHEILNSLTPVTSLAGTAAALLDEPDPDLAEARLAVATLARRAEGMRRFIDSYRSVSRLPAPRRSRFAAAPFAAEIARLFAAEWTAHQLAVEIDADRVLDADPDLLAQLLINLLRNAAQATADVTGGGKVRLGIGSASGSLVISVEDNGPGVPAAARGDVFLPFFTTRAEGTGIGLNLVRQIAIAHGWRVEIGDSPALGGAAFRVFLPANT